jgi:leucyl-tRNA synthetase
MPQWAGSSWYFLRYADPHNDTHLAKESLLKYWMPIDIYFGGMEHTTLHLLYSRFWNLFLHDQGIVPVAEPYARRIPHGIILASDGEKMSKSRGNVVNPDDIVGRLGADTLRMYELFLGPHEQMVSWNDQGIIGVRRFLDRVWTWVHEKKSAKAKDSDLVVKEFNKLVKRVTEDLEQFRFNTAISQKRLKGLTF